MFKTLLRTTCVTLGLSIAPIAVMAQASQPVQVVVPYNPGGGSDLFGRMVAPAIGKALDKTAIVENRAGAGGIIGTETVTRSTPPSQMFLVSDSAVYTIIPSLYSPLGYAAKDLIPVANIASFGNVLVVPANSRFKTFQDVLDEARKSPNKLTIGSSGAGGITHLAAERLMEQAKIKLVHVPYKGSGPAITDTVGGHIDMVFTGLPSVLELLRSGKLRALAIGTEERSPYAKDIPTISESGVPGFSAMISQGLFAPAHTSPETVEKLNKAVRDFMNQPDTKETLRKMTVDPVDQSSADYKAWLDKEGQEWAALIKRADIKVQ